MMSLIEGYGIVIVKIVTEPSLVIVVSFVKAMLLYIEGCVTE